ncbi:hypothetical protein AMTR_s00094p00054460 [Amborella trichopoda]|uniref:Uncharacterized protein n=1 Tax=Amborella trichopoda TaxID=13333 RepID=W1NUG4_AMBTC|nr:hypothetical protein AMTR_s00094p00054460 [Amborella trichopoda]
MTEVLTSLTSDIKSRSEPYLTIDTNLAIMASELAKTMVVTPLEEASSDQGLLTSDSPPNERSDMMLDFLCAGRQETKWAQEK